MIYSLFSIVALLSSAQLGSAGQGYLRATATSAFSAFSASNASSASSSSSGGEILTELDMMMLLSDDFNEEPWVPEKNPYKHDPLEFYETADSLRSIQGVVEESSGGGPLLLDMVDRYLRRGYITQAFPNLMAFQMWIAINSNANPQFMARYAFLPKPTLPYGNFMWRGSAGLGPGDFRTIQLGQPIAGQPVVEWSETAMVYKVLTIPDCVETPLLSPASTTRSNILTLLAGQRKFFIPAGTTVTEAIDPLGNHYFLFGRRGQGPNPTVISPGGVPVETNTLPPGWLLNRNRVLTEDFSSRCFYSKSIPKNKEGDDGGVCKEVQLNDLSSSAFILAELAGGDKDNELPIGNLLLSGGANPLCAPFTIHG